MSGLRRALSRTLLLLTLICSAASASAETRIYYYDPDANLKDIAKLKTEVQSYFRKADPGSSLTAFVRMEDLVSAMKSSPPDFLVAASWFTKAQAARLGYKPLLVGHMGASKSYHKVLIAKTGTTPADSASLSMVRFGENSSDSLRSLVPDIGKYPNLNVVEVSKDIDAVLAVSFGQVDMALVRQQNIDAIRKVNASAVANLRVLGKSLPIEYPVLSASPKTDPELIDKVVKALQSPDVSGDAGAMDLLGFQGWTNR